jgi:hypothetical protein
MTLDTVLRGWWGLLSVVATPLTLVLNGVALVRLLRIPAAPAVPAFPISRVEPASPAP